MANREGIDLDREGVLGVARVFKSYQRMIAVIVLVGAMVTYGISLLVPETWQARATIVPSSLLTGKSQDMGLNSLASQFSGASMLLSGGQENASSLYPWILSSRSIGAQALAQEFTDIDGETSRLIDRLAAADSDTLARTNRALKILRQAVVVKFDRKSSVSSVVVTMEDPVVAADLANFMVAALDKFSRSVQVTEAGDQFQFISQRLDETQASLAAAESVLMEFEVSNRNWANSPQLKLRYNRHARDVQLNQELFVTLRTQMEMAHIEAVKTMPLISVIDQASPPLDVAAPQRFKITLAAVFFLFVAGMVIALSRNYLRFSAQRAAAADNHLGN